LGDVEKLVELLLVESV